MKIAVLTSSYPRYQGDGAAPFIKSFSETLAKLGSEVEVVAPFDPEVKPDEQGNVRVHRFRYIWPDRWSIMGHARSLEADVRLHPLSYLLLPLFLLSEFFTLLAVTKRQESQAIHVHWVIPNGPAAALVARLRKIPFIISLHGSDIYVAEKNPIFGRIAGWVFKQASGITACSPPLRQSAIRLGAPVETIVLPYGADSQIFSPSKRKADFHASFGLKPTDFLILALGRLVYKKGFSILLEALPEVRAAYPNTYLILAGEGVIKEELVQRAKKLGIYDRVIFSGGIPWTQVPTYLASADIFVLPSVKDQFGNVDGLPNVLLEAMSAGAGVVASDIGGVGLVLQSGVNGLLTLPGDPHALAEAIINLASDPERRDAFGQAARQTILEKFTWEQVVSQIVQLLKKATGQEHLEQRI